MLRHLQQQKTYKEPCSSSKNSQKKMSSSSDKELEQEHSQKLKGVLRQFTSNTLMCNILRLPRILLHHKPPN